MTRLKLEILRSLSSADGNPVIIEFRSEDLAWCFSEKEDYISVKLGWSNNFFVTIPPIDIPMKCVSKVWDNEHLVYDVHNRFSEKISMENMQTGHTI